MTKAKARPTEEQLYKERCKKTEYMQFIAQYNDYFYLDGEEIAVFYDVHKQVISARKSKDMVLIEEVRTEDLGLTKGIKQAEFTKAWIEAYLDEKEQESLKLFPNY